MRFAKLRSRLAMALAMTAAAGTAVLSGAPAASASTIPNGYIQLCAQGEYRAYFHILPRTAPRGQTNEAQSITINPGVCIKALYDTKGGSSQVDIVAVRPDGAKVFVATKWWNSSTGIGIGVEGKLSQAPYLYTW